MPPLIEPDWPAPASVVALSTTRAGGTSAAPFDSLNLGHHVGDSEAAVAANREILGRALPVGSVIPWMSQVHGIEVVQAGQGGLYPRADAAFSREPGMVCAVMTADCLPVLLCATDGTAVAAAHAGWRGLLGGVLEATVAAMNVPGKQLLAWLGPAIGPATFEVGGEVREQFLGAALAAHRDAVDACFAPSSQSATRYFADLCALARLRLNAVGVDQVFGGGYCTYSDPGRFYSYRRDGRTGRMASLIMLR